MSKRRFLVGVLTITLIFGMTVVGCDDEPLEDDSRFYFYGNVSLDNYYPVVGETITASFNKDSSSNDPIGTPSWQWYSTEVDDGRLSYISTSNKTSIGYGNTYTVKQIDVGFWIFAEISYSGSKRTEYTRTFSTVIGIPATATVSVSIKAERLLMRDQYLTDSNHRVTVTLTLSDGRWNNVSYSTASQWLTMSGTPSVSSWYTGYATPSVSA